MWNCCKKSLLQKWLELKQMFWMKKVVFTFELPWVTPLVEDKVPTWNANFQGTLETTEALKIWVGGGKQ